MFLLSSQLCSFQCCRPNLGKQRPQTVQFCVVVSEDPQSSESQGHSLCLPFFLSQDNFCFYLYCFWSIRSFIRYSYPDSPHQEQKRKQICHKGMALPSQTTDVLLMRAGQLVTHLFPWVWDPECLCIRFRWVSVSHSSFCHLLVMILEALDTSGFSLTASCLFTAATSQTPLQTPELLTVTSTWTYLCMILPLYFTLIILRFTHPFWHILLSKPSPPPPSSCPNQKSSFQKQWHFKSARTKTSLPNLAWYQ